MTHAASDPCQQFYVLDAAQLLARVSSPARDDAAHALLRAAFLHPLHWQAWLPAHPLRIQPRQLAQPPSSRPLRLLVALLLQPQPSLLPQHDAPLLPGEPLLQRAAWLLLPPSASLPLQPAADPPAGLPPAG